MDFEKKCFSLESGFLSIVFFMVVFFNVFFSKVFCFAKFFRKGFCFFKESFFFMKGFFAEFLF